METEQRVRRLLHYSSPVPLCKHSIFGSAMSELSYSLMGIYRVGSVLLPHPGACIIQFLHVFPCFGKDAIFFPLGGVTYNEMFTKCIMSLQKGLCYMLRLVSLSTSSLCPPCASAFLARRSSERGWPLLHMLIAGHCELCAGLVVLLRHQRAPRVSVEQGPGSWHPRHQLAAVP